MAQVGTSSNFLQFWTKFSGPCLLYLYLGAAEFWWKTGWKKIDLKDKKSILEQRTQLLIFVFIPRHFDLCHFLLFFFLIANMKEDSRVKQRKWNLNFSYSTSKNKALCCTSNLVIRLFYQWTSFLFLTLVSCYFLFSEVCYPRPQGSN